MYEKDGHMYSLEEVQAAADKNQLSLEEYIKSRGLKLTSKEKKEVPKSDHITREEFEYSRGRKVEENLLKKLREKYKDKSFKFDTAWDGRDEISVTNAKGVNQKFYLDSDYNRNAQSGGRYSDSLSDFGSYDDFVNFLDSDDSTPEQKYIYKKTGLTPDNYLEIRSGEPTYTYDSKMDKMRTSGVTVSKADETTQKEILDLASTEIARIYRDPHLIGGVDHSFATRATLTPEEDKKIHDHVFKTIKNKTGLDITRDSYMKMVGAGAMEKGLAAKLKAEGSRRESADAYSVTNTQSYTKSVKNLKEQESQTWLDNRSKDGKNWESKVQLNKDLQKVQADIKKLQETLENDPNANKESIVDQIDDKEVEKELILKDIKKAATRKKWVKLDPKDVGRWVEEVDEDVLSLMVGEKGYREQSAKNIKESYTTTKNTLENQLATIKSSDPTLNDYQAQVLLQERSYIYYDNLLKEGNNKKITFDLSDYNRKTRVSKGGIAVNPYDNIVNKIKENPHLELGENGKIDLSYNDLHSLGLSGRHFDGFFDTFKNNISEKDKEWIRVHEEALDNAEGKRYALWELTDLNVDPEKITKKGPLTSFVNAAAKTTAVEVFGYTEHEADKLVAGVSGKSFTTRYTLDKFKEVEPYINEVLKEEIESGKVQKFEFTKEQAENLERTLVENVAEGVGHFVPTLVKLGIISSVTGGAMSWMGGMKVLQKLGQSKNLFDKLLHHGGMVMLEEFKMNLAGFKPTAGAAFYTGGVLTRGLTPFAAGGKFAYLDPIWQKVIKGGPVGAASMELASITELWYDDLMENKDFKTNFDEMFGDFDEVKKRLITNSLVFGIIGASHVKKMDFYSTGGKFDLIAGLEIKKENILGEGKKGPNKKYENLTESEKRKYDGYTKAQSLLDNQIQIETMVRELDPNSKDFEKNYQKRYTDPLNKAIKKVIPEYKGFTVKFYEGGNAWRKRNWGNPRNSAEFRPEKREVAIDKSMYTPGKEIHEFTHAAFRAVFDANPELKLNFTKKMSKLFEDYDNLPGTGMKLTDLIKEAVKGPKETHGKTGDLRTKESKNLQAEEFISYMVEFLSNPNVYYNTVSTNLVKDVKQEIIDIFEENFGYQPKIKNAGQFIDFLGRLAIGARRGTSIENKAARMAQLDQIDFLGIEYKQGPSRTKEKEAAMGSTDLVKIKNDLLQKNLKIAKEKPEGWRQENKTIANEIQRINKLIDTSERNEINAKKYKEAVDARESLFEQKPELKDRDIPDPKLERAAAELRESNMGTLNEFVKEGWAPIPGSEITKVDFKRYVESTEFNNILNSYYKPKEKTVDGKKVITGESAYERGVPFGAYLRLSLLGKGYVLGRGKPQRQGNVLRALQGGKSQDKTIKTVSIYDAEGKIRADVLKVAADEVITLDGGSSPRGSVGEGQVEASLINVKQKFDLTTKHIESIETKIDVKTLKDKDYGEFVDLTPDLTLELFGGTKTYVTQKGEVKPVVFGESAKNIEKKAQFIADKFETIYDMLPEGAMIGFGEGAKAKAKEGRSTNVEPMLLNGKFYEASSRTGEEAQSSFKKTGSGAGLPVQNKIKNLTKEKFLEKLGIFLKPDGKTVDIYDKKTNPKGKTKITSQTKNLRAIDALITETGKAITNQITRAWLNKKSKDGKTNYENNPQLAQELSIDALLHQLSVGKSASLASRNLYDIVEEIGGNVKKGAQLVNLFIRDRKTLLKTNPNAYGEIKDLIETRARVYAKEGKAADYFMTSVKKTEWKDLLGKDAMFLLSDKKFKDDPVAQKKFQKMAYDLAKNIPAIDILKQSGNAKVLLDLFAGHYNIVGPAKAKVASKFKDGIRDNLASSAKEMKLSPELVKRWENFDWTELKSSYASSFYTGYDKIMKAGTIAQQRAIAKEYFKSSEGKIQRELYDLWNSTLQEWLYVSPKGSKAFNSKADYILKLKKANGAVGTTSERILAPGGYIYLPGKAFEGTIKYEHLKSSSQQSFESAMLILDGKWTTKGKKTLSKYKGIYGLLSDFNIVDKNTGKINNSDIFRFAENLELAKHIYRIDGKFKTSLYQDIVSRVGKEQIKNLENFSKNDILDKALANGRIKNKEPKGISVFDFDQTLANTKEKVIVTIPNDVQYTRNGKLIKRFKIGAAEFAREAEKLEAKGAKFDFSEFEKVVGGTKGPLANLALKRAGKFGTGDIFILTARPQSAAPAIKAFMKGMGIDIPLKNITGLESGKPEAKSDWVKKKAAEGYNDFYFADDAIKNVKAVSRVLNQIDVKSDVQQALASRNLSKDFNDIIEKKTGIASHKIYSRSKGQVQGANKGRFKFWIPPSAEDFVGLIYPTLGKGKEGDAQMAWYKKNLLDPYARGENGVTKERSQLMRDFHALKKEIPDVPKGLRDKIEKGPAKGYTKEQAMRVYVWNKQGMKVPELTKTDLKKLLQYVNANKSLQEFADKLILINKGDGYAKPGSDWLAGTVTTDLFDGLNTTKRQKHLKEWVENKNIIFSKANLNKYEASFGKPARAALENILERMESGRNRKKLGGYFQKLENEVLDWTNNSVGAIMFLNSRSAVLQTISALNYINFRDNNPLAAAKAFANQPQYWKDFNYLFNSEYLVQRRDGLKININEAEIAEMAETSTNKPKAALAYLLKKGFIMTRHADSFAIASGGASFYRNRINAYKKQGLSEKQAKEKAFVDWRELTEEAQQSSRPDRISAQQASGLGRVVLAFANTPMQYARLQKRAIQDLYNGRGDAKTNLSKITYYGFVQNLIFNALQQAMFAIGFDEDPEDQKQIMNKSGRLINGMLDSQLRGLGYGGAAIAAVKNVLHKISEEHAKGRPKYENASWEFLDFSPPISSKVTKIRSAMRSLDYDLDEMQTMGFSLDNPAYLAGGNVLSATVNLPVDRVIKKMNNIQDAFDEEQEMWAKIALLAGWNEWELGLEEDKKKSKKKSPSRTKEGKTIRF